MLDYTQFNPFFDQEQPDLPIDGLIASEDISASYELDAAAVFKAGERFLVVEVSGCSCWPDRGSTYQAVCETKSDVDRALAGKWPQLAAACQHAQWTVTEVYKPLEQPSGE